MDTPNETLETDLIRCTIPSIKDIANRRIAAVNLDNFKGAEGREVLGLKIESFEIVGDIVIADINIVLKPSHNTKVD